METIAIIIFLAISNFLTLTILLLSNSVSHQNRLLFLYYCLYIYIYIYKTKSFHPDPRVTFNSYFIYQKLPECYNVSRLFLLFNNLQTQLTGSVDYDLKIWPNSRLFPSKPRECNCRFPFSFNYTSSHLAHSHTPSNTQHNMHHSTSQATLSSSHVV